MTTAVRHELLEKTCGYSLKDIATKVNLKKESDKNKRLRRKPKAIEMLIRKELQPFIIEHCVEEARKGRFIAYVSLPDTTELEDRLPEELDIFELNDDDLEYILKVLQSKFSDTDIRIERDTEQPTLVCRWD